MSFLMEYGENEVFRCQKQLYSVGTICLFLQNLPSGSSDSGDFECIIVNDSINVGFFVRRTVGCGTNNIVPIDYDTRRTFGKRMICRLRKFTIFYVTSRFFFSCLFSPRHDDVRRSLDRALRNIMRTRDKSLCIQ